MNLKYYQFINLDIQSLNDPFGELNDFRDMRYWVKTTYQLKYQDQDRFSKIQDTNASALPAQYQDLMNQKTRCDLLFFVFTDLLYYESETLC
jgi:hypothetical protein